MERFSGILAGLLICNSLLVATPAFVHSSYFYVMNIDLDHEVTVEFLLNSPSPVDPRMYYDQNDPDSFLYVWFPSTYGFSWNDDGSYPNTLHIQRNSGEVLMGIKTNSDDFYYLDPVKQVQFLFEEIKFRIGGIIYILDLEYLTSESFVWIGTWENGFLFSPGIRFYVNQDFLDTYCTIQV